MRRSVLNHHEARASRPAAIERTLGRFTSRRGFVVLLAAICGGSLALATQADACSVVNGKHCYAVELWKMQESPAEVMGAYADESLGSGRTPNWSPEGEGGFQDAEMWVTFPAFNENAWVEAGATIGWPYSETEPRYFVARSYNEKNYWEHIYTSSGPPYGSWFGYYIDEPYGQNGEWCLTWKWDTSPDYCFTGFPKSSKELQGGLEYATTTASGAEINGILLGWQQWTNGAWYENWESTWNRAFPSWNSPMCINVPAPGHNYGSIAFSAPDC